MCLAEPPAIPGIPVKRLDAEWLGGCPIGDPKDQGRLKIHVLIAWSKETVEQSKGASSLFNDKHSLLYFVTAQISTAQTTVPNFSLPTLLHTTLHYYITTLTFPPIEPNTSVWISTTSLVHDSHILTLAHFSPHTAIHSSTIRLLATASRKVVSCLLLQPDFGSTSNSVYH